MYCTYEYEYPCALDSSQNIYLLILLQKSHLQYALDNYLWLVDYCDRHRDDAEKAFAQELPMCKEMVELLPLKISVE